MDPDDKLTLLLAQASAECECLRCYDEGPHACINGAYWKETAAKAARALDVVATMCRVQVHGPSEGQAFLAENILMAISASMEGT